MLDLIDFNCFPSLKTKISFFLSLPTRGSKSTFRHSAFALHLSLHSSAFSEGRSSGCSKRRDVWVVFGDWGVSTQKRHDGAVPTGPRARCYHVNCWVDRPERSSWHQSCFFCCLLVCRCSLIYVHLDHLQLITAPSCLTNFLSSPFCSVCLVFGKLFSSPLPLPLLSWVSATERGHKYAANKKG